MKRNLAGLLAAAALLLSPFLAKPFHIDDAYQLRVARQIKKSPLRPYETRYNWTGTPAPIWLNNLHPPLNAYILAAAAAVTGGDEVPLHSCYLFISLACIFWMYRVAHRLCRYPALPVLMTLASPAFFLSATSVMTDIPMLMFWLLAVSLALEAARPNRAVLYWGAGAAAACAAMTNLYGLSLVPLLLADWAARSHKRTPHLLGLLLPIGAIGLWGLYAMTQIGFFHPGAAAAFAATAGREAAFAPGVAAAFLGGCLLWPLVLIPALPTMGARASLLCLTVWLVLWALMPAGTGSFWALLALGGILTAATALLSAAEDSGADSLLLLLWFFGTLVFAGALNWTVSARSLLPCAFPAALFTVRWIETSRMQTALLTAVRCALIPSLGVTLMLAASDQEMAAAQRDFARQVGRRFLDRGARVFFIGHWGFQHYMEKEGAVAFDYRHPQLQKGDVLLVSTNNTGARPLPPRLRSQVRTHTILPANNTRGIQTTDVEGKTAGFYSSLFGSVPFALGRGLKHDSFLIEVHEGP